jgi:peptide/nickel transport system ATP-binding protein
VPEPPGKIESGKIELAGRDLLPLSEREMRGVRGNEISMVFQEPMTSLNPVYTVGWQIVEAIRLHQKRSRGDAWGRAVELLTLVGIPSAAENARAYPHQLSGGMRQRVMIAIAVACKPRLLIADEPTTALDVTIQAQVLDLLDRLRRELSMGLILITHDLGIVAQWADRVVVMYAGRKVEEGLPEEMFREPFHPYTQGLLAASPRLHADYHYRDGPLIEIPGNITSAAAEPGCPFVPRCPAALGACRLRVPSYVEPYPGRLVACPVITAPENSRAATVGY